MAISLSALLTGRALSQKVLLALISFRFRLQIFIRQLLVCYFVAPSLMRGRVWFNVATGPRQRSLYRIWVAGLLFCSALSDERTGLWFTFATGPSQCSPARVWVPRTQDHTLLSQFLRLPQPGRPGPRIYIPREQRVSDISKVKFQVILRPTKCSHFLFEYFLESFMFVDVRRLLWREVGSAVFSFCRATPAKPFSDLSPTELMSIFYCLYFWDSPNLEDFISPRNRVAQLYPRALGANWPCL
jgi:hypothetical protein